MTTYYKDYPKRVMEKYHVLSSSKKLSPRLNQPTLAGLRDECVDIFRSRYQRKDEQTLRAFFRYTGEMDSLAGAIEGFDTGKFKALCNFLLGKSSDTSHKNIELLAWLIDFEHRPYDRDRRIPVPVEEPPIREQEPLIGGGEAQDDQPTTTDTTVEPVAPPHHLQLEKERKSKRRRMIAWSIGLATIAGWSGYLVSKSNPPSKQCMYWAVDHFERVSCSEPKSGRFFVDLDSARIKLRLITRPDTITYRSIGKVWYLKKNNQVEYFTDSGRHPVHLTSRLKPISARIIDSHILKHNRKVD
jgi:hypothetical protein